MTHHLIAMRRTALMGLILIAILYCPPAQAQLEELTGRRVRVSLVRTPGGISTSPIGVLREVTADSLVLSAEDEIVSIPRSTIQRLDVSIGTKRMTGQGALAGLAVGAFTLGAVAATGTDTDSCGGEDVWLCFEPSVELAALGGAMTGALLGAVLGAAIGSSIQTDRWERVDLRFSAIAPAPGRSLAPLPTLRLVVRI